jgi:predicted nucleic acid-binding protein
VTRFAIDPATLVRLAEGNYRISANHQLVAPNSIRSLALDLLLQRVRNGELTEPRAVELHERITEIKIRLLGDRVSRRTAWQIALAQDWNTIRLAEYIAVAKLQADVLIAVDPDLAAAAASSVPVATFADLIAP